MDVTERWKRFRELPTNIEHSLRQLTPLFEKEGVLLVYLFGSTGKGQVGQDVDLAILTQGEPAFRLREMIATSLGTERLDLVDLRSASPVLRFEILRTGRPLYVHSKEIQERFELETLHLYRDTAPLRLQQRKYLKRRIAQWSSGEK